jgi:hypothetical protein
MADYTGQNLVSGSDPTDGTPDPNQVEDLMGGSKIYVPIPIGDLGEL